VGERRGRLGAGVDRLFDRLAARYVKALPFALHHRATVVGLAVLFFVVSTFGIIPFLRQEFVPAQDTNSFQIRFQTPVGTSLDVTEAKLREVETLIRSHGEV